MTDFDKTADAEVKPAPKKIRVSNIRPKAVNNGLRNSKDPQKELSESQKRRERRRRARERLERQERALLNELQNEFTPKKSGSKTTRKSKSTSQKFVSKTDHKFKSQSQPKA